MAFWNDVLGAVASGASKSNNPYLSAAGGILGGGGGSGPVVVATPPPPPPPPPGPQANVGNMMQGLGMGAGFLIVAGLAFIVILLRRK